MKKRSWLIGSLLIICLLIIIGYHYIDMDVLICYIKNLPIFYKIIAFIGLIALQIILAFLPGEPLELAIGYIFGSWIGTLICLLGSFIGTITVYFLVRIFKHELIFKMFQKEKIEKVEKIISTKKSLFWFYIIFLIPGSPKDIMTYVSSLGNIPVCQWLILTSVCRLPSIVSSTFLSGSIKKGHITLAIVIFLVTIAIVIAGMTIYKKLSRE